MSINLKSHTIAELRQAVADGYRLFELDTGSSGNDDVLYDTDEYAVRSDVMFFHDLDEWPDGWTLREVPPNELFPT